MSADAESKTYRGSGSDAWPMITVDEALAVVLEQARPLPAVTTPLAQALGKIAAQEIYASEPLPPFVASVKDGYAVIAADTALERAVVSSVMAGESSATPLRPGQAAYITTGAPLPPGADAVIQVEDTERHLLVDGGERIRLAHAVVVGNDTRAVGSDIAAGDILVRAGERFGAAEIGLAATTGVRQVQVHGTPRVGILSTGNELLAADEPSRPGAIRDSNGSMLAAAVRAAGAEAIELGIAADRMELLRAIVSDAQRDCDLLLTTGGVSMGELDLMKHLAAELGTVHFGRLLMKPGKPCTFATLPRPVGSGDGRPMLYFGLPGNPVSALVTFYLLALPAIRTLMGWQNPMLPAVQAATSETLRLDKQRPEYHRAHLHWDRALNNGAGGWRALSTGNQVSSRLASFQRANALLALPAGEESLPAGSVVDALLLEGSPVEGSPLKGSL